MPLLMQAIWGDIWKRTVEKSQRNETNVTLHSFVQTVLRNIWNYTVVKSQTCDCKHQDHHQQQHCHRSHNQNTDDIPTEDLPIGNVYPPLVYPPHTVVMIIIIIITIIPLGTNEATKTDVFSCPEQLNRWPCHSLTHSLTNGTFTFDITEWP